jgi:DMSO/TMAO reductase YedYZ molybdopterin-dependent catalytic subunit
MHNDNLATGLYGRHYPINSAPIRLVVPWKYGSNHQGVAKIELADQQLRHILKTINRSIMVLFQRNPKSTTPALVAGSSGASVSWDLAGH